MASTLTLQDSINWVQPYVRYKPLVDSNNQPAFDNANQILQTMLAPPFVWRWNRKIAPSTIPIVSGTQDYALPLSDFGFLEKAAVTPIGAKARELEIVNVMGVSNVQEMDVPNKIGAVLDDNNGNITFRILPVPDATYTGNLVYQMKPVLFTSVSQTWAPIPDEYSIVFNKGFLYMAYEYFDDPRASMAKQAFALTLIGISEGLDDTQKNIFLGKYLDTLKQEIRASAGASQQIQGRGV